MTGVRQLAGRVRRRLRSRRPTGPPRSAEPDATHLGPVMDHAVARVRARMQPAGLDAGYDRAYEHFDLTHFLLQARHFLDGAPGDPLAVFLANGADATASPEVNFAMASYLARHPERRGGRRSPYLAWLEEGRAAGEIADPAPGLDDTAAVLGLPPAELADLLGRTRTDVQERLRHGVLGEMLARAADVEPLIGAAWPATTRPVIAPLYSPVTVAQVAAIRSGQEQAGFARARVVLVISDPRWGGGRRAEGHIAHALAGEIDPHEVVVIYTDAGGTAPRGRFPDGVREVDLASSVTDLPGPAAQRALVELVRSLRADVVVGLNSTLLYDALSVYGKALATTERIVLVLLCNEQLATGHWVGLPLRYFYRCFDLVDHVVTDSDYLADWLRTRHRLDPASDARLGVLRAPVDAGIPVAPAPGPATGRRPQVFWAGRWDRQKRVDLALEVARRMPEVDVRMWGESVLTAAHLDEVPANVTLEGPYDHLSDLDLSAADAWLYTSAWDGVPSLLLEVAMTGVPVVGTVVGGTGEVLDPDGAWPVPETDDPEPYVAALREVIADPQAARTRAARLRQRLLVERTPEAFARQVHDLLLSVPRGEER